MAFEDDMIRKIRCLLQDNVGVEMVQVGDTQVRYTDLVKQLDHWESRQAVQQGKRPRVSRIDLSGFAG